MYVDSNWNYNDVVCNIEALKTEYEGILASFSWKDLKKETKFISDFKKKIYNLKMGEYKRNMIWEYLNGDKNMEDVIKLVR